MNRACALVVTGLVLFVISNSFPFLGLESAGQTQSTTLLSGVYALIDREQWILAALVFSTIFLFPLLELLALGYVLLFTAMGSRAKHLGNMMAFLFITRPWSMMEIFLFGVLVTSVKLGSDAQLIVGAGIYAFAALVVVLIATHLEINRTRIWNWYRPDNYFTQHEGEELVSCPLCNAMIGRSIWKNDPQCPRCEKEIQPRIRHSMQKTVALLIAATILYIPANTLPLTRITTLGAVESRTIIGSIIDLFQHGLWVIALVVFVASMVVPIAKLIIMTYLLWSVHHKSSSNLATRMRLYHLTEFVGRWSMVDVFVVTLLVALVQFGLLVNIEPGSAALSFAAVVVLTMLAVETFDSRLLWDGNHDQHRT